MVAAVLYLGTKHSWVTLRQGRCAVNGHAYEANRQTERRTGTASGAESDRAAVRLDNDEGGPATMEDAV